MRLFHSLMICGLVACGGSEFTSSNSGGHAGTGGIAGTGGAGGAGHAGSGGAMGGSRDAAVDAPSNAGGGGPGPPDAAPRNSGDCDTKDDCGGDPCVELVPGGYRVCISPVPEATMCSVPPGTCCRSSDCSGTANGKCVLGPAQPSCGGPAIVPTNVCVVDACKRATDCPGVNAICQPPGMLGAKAGRCVNGGCLYDRDCPGSGASCAPIVDSCCNAFVGLYCVYPDGCRSDSNCPTAQHCVVQGNRTVCMPGAATCPLASP